MLYLEIYLNIFYSLIWVLFSVGFIHMIFSAFFEVWSEKRLMYKSQK